MAGRNGEHDTGQAAGLSARARPAPPYLAGLNPEQRLAVETLDGPLLVLAGAGTGKTRVLTARLAHLIHTGRAWPSQILAVTFTNKAAREMRERAGQLLGRAVEGMPWLGTFHAICARMLRRHAELVGLEPNFTILDTDDQLRLLKQILSAENIDDRRWPARMLAGMIDRWKNRAWTPEHVPEEEAGFAGGRGRELYAFYQRRLATLNAVDFGDLLLHMVRIFQTRPEVLAEYQNRIRYLLVDEYQDTNVAQYLWLRLLAQGHRNICVVGDDDQSIYAWRGAEIGNILRFEKDFEGAKVVRLERNYRSTPHILAAASRVIAGNRGRLGKTLRTHLEAGERVRLIGHWDGEEEARWIGEEIEALNRGTRGLAPVPLDGIAILVRASFQMRAFEDRFLNIGLPYRVVGGPRFYERMEIRDAIAYFRLAVSPTDGLAFERVVNTPKRGLGEKAQQHIHRVARERGVGLVEAARIAAAGGEGLTRGAAASLSRLLADIDRWHAELAAPGADHVELARRILDESGYTAMWQADKSPDAPGRLENLKELVQALEEFENLQGFLEHVALVMDNDTGEGGEKVSIMTLHAAKGLEFPAVFLPGWEDGLFPSQRTLDEEGEKGLEEERRLAYVGMTRAKELLTISFAANRQVYGRWQSTLPSRFIDELPPEHVEVLTPPGLYGGRATPSARGAAAASALEERAARASTYNSPGWQRLEARRAEGAGGAAGPARRPPRPALVDAEALARFEEGARVFHQKFGYGRIAAIEGDKLTVTFDKAGEKRLLASFVVPAGEDGSLEDIPF